MTRVEPKYKPQRQGHRESKLLLVPLYRKKEWSNHMSNMPSSAGLSSTAPTLEILGRKLTVLDPKMLETFKAKLGDPSDPWAGIAVRNQPSHSRGRVFESVRGVVNQPTLTTRTEPSTPRLPTRAIVGKKSKGKNIDARMLKEIADNLEALSWSARQWATYLDCSDGTVKATKTWKERLSKIRASLAADATIKKERTRCHPSGRQKLQHRSKA